MPEFFPFGKFQDAAVGRACEHDFLMRTIYIRECRDEVRSRSVTCPFAVVEGLACRSLDGLYQLSVAVGNQDALVRGVAFSGKFPTGFSAEVEEGGTLAAILCERCIAGLLAVVPDGVAGFFGKRGAGIGDAGS